MTVDRITGSCRFGGFEWAVDCCSGSCGRGEVCFPGEAPRVPSVELSSDIDRSAVVIDDGQLGYSSLKRGTKVQALVPSLMCAAFLELWEYDFSKISFNVTEGAIVVIPDVPERVDP